MDINELSTYFVSLGALMALLMILPGAPVGKDVFLWEGEALDILVRRLPSIFFMMFFCPAVCFPILMKLSF